MRRTIILGGVLSILSGCAANNVALTPSEMPVCNAGKDCEMKWAMARRWLLNNSGFKIQNITDDFIETFNIRDSTSPAPWVRIVKEPLDDTRYRISLEMGCNNPFGCVPDVRGLLSNFQAAMASGSLAAMPAPPPPPPPRTPAGGYNPNAR